MNEQEQELNHALLLAQAIFGTVENLKTVVVTKLAIARVAKQLHPEQLWSKVTKAGNVAGVVSVTEYEADPRLLNRKTLEVVCALLDLQPCDMFDGVTSFVVQKVKFGHVLSRESDMFRDPRSAVNMWGWQVVTAAASHARHMLEALDLNDPPPVKA
jgi:hypothetical protein